MRLAVTAVIPTVGRPALRNAVRSVLAQTRPVAEVIVVADTDTALDLPQDNRIRLLRNASPLGAAGSRQRGIDDAGADVVALLDDDDEWYPTKLQRQLDRIERDVPPGVPWVAASSIAVLGPGSRRRIWPRRLIEPHQRISDYLFRFRDFRVGGAVLQTSSLCFPAELAHTVRWDTCSDAVHDEPTWLIEVQRRYPDIRMIQLPDVLSTYSVGHQSVSHQELDDTDRYIEWGLRYLGEESARIVGDYLCTSPVSAAVSAGSLAGVGRSLQLAIRHGRPGPYAVAYALMNGVRIAGRSAVSLCR
jgi:glycosyltransferase involved in cell wall biosynthesis